MILFCFLKKIMVEMGLFVFIAIMEKAELVLPLFVLWCFVAFSQGLMKLSNSIIKGGL
jgi:hypothetical protein